MSYRDYYLTLDELAQQTGRSRKTLVQWARRERDPLPLRVPDGMERGYFIRFSELAEWIDRNTRELI